MATLYYVPLLNYFLKIWDFIKVIAYTCFIIRHAGMNYLQKKVHLIKTETSLLYLTGTKKGRN